MSIAKQQAENFVNACKKYGFNFEAKVSVVTITKSFTPGDKEAFTELDMINSNVLALVPLKGGSVWGTDGGSIGGYSALKSGQFRMNKSGDGSRFMAALRKLQGA
jgi:hypothetical protein